MTRAMDAQNPQKRKRSAMACTRCHDRKVRCSAAFQGFPCANCAQDGTACTVYQPQSARQDPSISTGSDDRLPKPGSPAYPLTPTPSLVPPAEVSRRTDPSATTRPKESSEPAVGSDDILQGAQRHSSARFERAAREGLVPYYAGEVGGHEFLFDVCSPNRSLRGSPYLISRNVQKRSHFKLDIGSRPRFPATVCKRLLHCFFDYVYPFMPVVSAGDFLSKYILDPKSVSPLLLWSVFFSATSYLDEATVSAAGFKSRKHMKEFCYQNAKAIYDAQLEADKTTIISSTLLLAFWYIDLEDLDGTGYWVNIAIHLCHSIGLQREPNYARLPRCPFPATQRALWRRLWWCVYHRDAWFCLGSGRPMHVHIDDCDLQLPTVEDITIDLRDLSAELRQEYFPHRIEWLAEIFIRMLHLSMKLEYAMILHYKPRRPTLSIPQLEADYADVLRLLDGLDQETEHESRLLTLHASHFRCFVNAVVIILYRQYILSSPANLNAADRDDLQRVAIQACKSAAADVTTTMNKLITRNMIETSPTTIVTPIMMVMQIHFYELSKSEGLLRQHALHNLNLHFMVLTHLKKTFWTADMHHNLFTECVKALNSGKTEEKQYGGYAAGLQDPVTAARSNTPHVARDDHDPALGTVMEPAGLVEAAFEDFFAPFTPFDNFSALFEDRLEYNASADPGLT